MTYTVQVGDFGFSDPNNSPSNNLLSVTINSLPLVGTLTNNGTDNPAVPFTISAAAIAAGQLTYRAPNQANGNALASIRFQVKDDGGTAIVGGIAGVDLDPTENVLSFNVASVNDAPSGTPRTLTAAANTVATPSAYTFSVSDFSFTDANDTPVNALASVTITTLPALGTIVLNGQPVTATHEPLKTHHLYS